MNNSELNPLRILPHLSSSRLLVLMLLIASSTLSQEKPSTAPAAQKSPEQRAELNLQAARQNPLQLRHFLLGMPKGGDLHNHLSGAVYAESWIRAAAEDHLCVDVAKMAFSKPQPASESGAEQPVCWEGKVPAATAYKDQHLFDALVDAFSMRGFVPSPGVTGHDHFFDAFAKFGGTDHRHLGEWIDEVATRAAAQNEQYLELMHTPEFPTTAKLATEIGWQEDFGKFRKELLERGIHEDIAAASAALDQAEALRRAREHCDLKVAEAACGVQVRYLCQVLRGLPKQIVFAQTVMCFEAAAVDPRLVEISLTSNDVILGVSGKDHPFPLYRLFGVPVALSSDDEGVSRIDITHEYVRAVQTYDLRYADLKRMVRTSLEHSFLRGASLWSAPDDFKHVVSVCSEGPLGADKYSSRCADFLGSNEKASQQWELERRFREFEAGL